MTDRPIMFSSAMVQALLDGRKTQTRRVLNPQPIGFDWHDLKCKPRFAVGDRLWVREAWKSHGGYDDLSPADMGGDEAIIYVADGAHQTWGYPGITKIGRLRAAMHMPRWASRLTLIVTDVRVQRLQDISEQDALAESMDFEAFKRGEAKGNDAISSYAILWDSLNGHRQACAWSDNPWICAVSFTVQKTNIDNV